jgi:pimeloyl-ACP methyl ester carboxylesterase
MLADGAPGSRPKVDVIGVVAQAGVLNMRAAQQQQVGGTAVSDFLGGTFAEVPGRYRIADPIEQVPLSVPVLCIHDRDDQLVPFSQSQSYVKAATAVGGRAALIAVDGDHFTLIDPTSAAWLTVIDHLPALLASHL